MKALCIGGENDGKVVEIDPAKRDGEFHILPYRVGIDGDETSPYPMGGVDDKITFVTERYEVRELRYGSSMYIKVLVFKPSATFMEILKALINGYRRPKEAQA